MTGRSKERKNRRVAPSWQQRSLGQVLIADRGDAAIAVAAIAFSLITAAADAAVARVRLHVSRRHRRCCRYRRAGRLPTLPPSLLSCTTAAVSCLCRCRAVVQRFSRLGSYVIASATDEPSRATQEQTGADLVHRGATAELRGALHVCCHAVDSFRRSNYSCITAVVDSR